MINVFKKKKKKPRFPKLCQNKTLLTVVFADIAYVDELTLSLHAKYPLHVPHILYGITSPGAGIQIFTVRLHRFTRVTSLL